MELGSLIGFGQLGLYFGLVYLFVRRYGSHLNNVDKWTAIWFGFDGLCHLLFEGAYVLFTLIGPIKNVKALIALPWNEYAKADFRWNQYDPTVLSLELLTVLVAGPMALAIVWAIITNNKWRHPLQLIICVCELYGGWMTFGPEWVIGSPNIDASNFTYLWLYLTIPNGVWVAIPVYLAWESIKHYFELLEGKKVPKSPKAKVVPAAAKPVDAEPIAVASPIASAAPKSPRGRKPVKK
jgi:hypothetical protein